MSGPSQPGAVSGSVRWLLRLEGLCVLAVALVANARWGMNWSTFALYFLVPDIAFLGYLAGPRVGAIAYNLTHSYAGAIVCLMAGGVLQSPIALSAGMLWCAHIGFDRALGYGLKYAAGFSHTHLGRIGKHALPSATPTSQIPG